MQKKINYSLANIKKACLKLNNPEKKLKNIIHIAGTNGKGSTLTFLASALIANGYKVATYTSPHLVSYTERFCINFKPIDFEKFVEYQDLIKSKTGDLFNNLTEFEVLTLISFLYFKEEKPDFIIYETGLGGRLDATNLVKPILSIITKIDYDHKEILGKSLKQIAVEKAGIIKKNTLVITIKQKKVVLNVIQKQAQIKNSEFNIVRSVSNIPKDFCMHASYQKQNLALAKKAIRILQKMGINLNHDKLLDGFKNAQILGRYQKITRNSQQIILDAAHNPAGIKSLIKALKREYPEQEFDFLIGIIKTKDVQEMLELIFKFAQKIYYCEFEDNLSIPFSEIHRLNPDVQKVKITDLKKLQSPNLIITGSIYFLGSIYPMLINNVNNNL